MDSAAGDAPKAVLTSIARMRLNADLMRLVKEKAAIAPTAPMAALKAARIAAQIVTTLGKLGVDLNAPRTPVAKAFALEGGPEPVPEPRVVTAKFYDFDATRKTSERKKDNTQAMALLRAIDAGTVTPPLDDAQKEILARYSGTGGNLVGEDGKRGSAYEYYTPKPIAAGMWDLMRELGFRGGKVLDPCAGVGIFGACAPANAAMETVELNETSGRINQLVNGGPGYNAIVSPFEAVASRTADEVYDAVISNVPFGGVHDRGSNRKIDAKYQDQPLETYFILRSLEKLKPGGLAAFIVPPRVVSAKGGREEQLRIAASYLAEFRGAYRLPNSVFGTADADTITDVIVFRKFSRDALNKIEELREQNPALLVDAKVQWTDFIGGVYFQHEGRKFVLGEFVAKDSNKFRDVDRVVSDQTVPNIAKLLRKFPDSRIDWDLINAAPTQPIEYNDGDTMTLAGQTLEMRGGEWVALGKAAEDDRFDGLGQSLSTATVAVTQKVDWSQSNDYVQYLRDKSLDMDMPIWLRVAHKDVTGLNASDRPKFWGAITAGMAAVEVMREHAEEVGFNYLEEYPAVSEALQGAAATAKRGAASLSRDSKAALQKVGIVFDRKTGFSDLWKGAVAPEVATKVLDENEQVEAVKYTSQGISIDVAKLKEILGPSFDPIADDGWCVNADGTKAAKADDYYTGNFAAFVRRIDAEIAQASGEVRDKLIRQKQAASDRLARVDTGALRFNLFSPYVDIEEKAEFLRRFMHPAFVVAFDDDGNKTIICDLNPKTERERQLKRFAEYLKKGNLSTRTKEDEARANPELDSQRRAMLKDMTIQANAQFDQWVKSNPVIMDRLNAVANDPEKLYFIEAEDTSPLQIEGLHPDCRPHGYQNAFVRSQGRSFGGINGFDVGLGKTMAALLAAQYVQSIGVKKKTFFVVPNTVLSNWRKEALIGNDGPGHPHYRPPVYASADGCLFVGLDVDEKTGHASVDPANYARDLNRVLENKHNKIFCTLEAFKLIPLKPETIEAYDAYLMSVDPSYAESEKNADSERAESKRAEATSGTGAKSSAIPYFEDMGIDSLVGDELHMYKNSKNTVDFAGAKFLSVAEASQRGLDVQMKAWYVRGLSPLGDGVLGLTATPITNSPLEIYSMLCLAVGEQRVHDLCLGAQGADAFMNVMCQIEDDEEETVDGRVKDYRVFRGLQNVDLLRNAIATVMTIKTAGDVKDGGDDLRMPEAPECKTNVQLTAGAKASLNQYKMAYRAARASLLPNSPPPLPEELEALAKVSEKFGESIELIAHPFNLINKMTLLIADPELDERATFYTVLPTDKDKAQAVIDSFNKGAKIEARTQAGPWTAPDAVVGVKIVRDGDNETKLAKIKVQAKWTKDGRIALDTMDTNLQAEFEKIADKAGLDLDCAIPPKLAALLANVQREEANPRSASGRVKQLIFCDVLPLHNKIKRMLTKHAGVAASAIVLVSGQSIKNAEQMQEVQDGFNSEGEENRYRYVIANEKAEVGINLQKGTQAIHHLTIGWTPDSTIQRNGRGVRQGNTTGRVNIYHYDADGTFDEYKRTLTSKKADWIGAVMDKQGGNDVAIAGGLTKQEYDELIDAVGDSGAIAAIRERAELKEKLARADSARARQVINLKTALSQKQFASKFATVDAWIVDRVVALHDLQQSVSAMADRAQSGKLNASGQIKIETRLAEARANVEDLKRELNEAASFEVYEYNYITKQSAKVLTDADGILRQTYGAKSAAKIRENIEGAARGGVRPKPGSSLESDWASEVAAAKGMVEEAIKDFERIAKDGGYPSEIAAAFKQGEVHVMDGKPFAKGMFVRDNKGALGVLNTATTIVRRGTQGRSVADAVSAGWTFIMFGTTEYERALVEAARIDDAEKNVLAADRAVLFSSIVPEVANRRKSVTLVGYSADRARLPAPLFPIPIDPEAPGISANLRAIADSQMSLITEWTRQKTGGWIYRQIKVSSTVPVGNGSGGDDTKKNIAALVDYAVGHGLKFTETDFKLVSGYSLAIENLLADMGKWPEGTRAIFAAAKNKDELEALGAQVAAAALPWLEADFSASSLAVLMPIKVRIDYNSRAYSLADEERRAARASNEENAVAPPATTAVATAQSPVPPNEKGLIGLTGETRPNKDIIKAAAATASGGRVKARWNGDKLQWDVPAETWAYLLQNHPRVAQVLQVVPA